MEGALPNDDYKIVNELIMHKGRVWLTSNSKVKEKVLKEHNDNPLVRHHEYYKTYKQIRERFSGKSLKKDVLKYVQECMICQRNKVQKSIPAGLLQPLPIPNQKWEKYFNGFHNRST